MVDLTALPSAIIARKFKSEVDLKLVSSFKYLLDVASKALNDSFEIQRQKIDELNVAISKPTFKLSSRAHIAHTKLKLSIEKQDAEEVRLILDYIKEANFTSNNINVGAINEKDRLLYEYETLSEVLRSGYLSSYGSEPDLKGLTQSDSDSNLPIVEQTLDVINDTYSSLFEEIEETTTDILLYESSFMNSGSSINYLGLISMSKLRPYQNWTTFLEAIAHEAGHQALYNIMLIEPILNDTGSLYCSPLRKEKRPMVGIFHAMFVVTRIILMMNKLKINFNGDLPKIVSPHNNSGNDRPAEEKFNVLYDTVVNHGKLTEIGKKITRSCRTIVEESISELP